MVPDIDSQEGPSCYHCNVAIDKDSLRRHVTSVIKKRNNFGVTFRKRLLEAKDRSELPLLVQRCVYYLGVNMDLCPYSDKVVILEVVKNIFEDHPNSMKWNTTLDNVILFKSVTKITKKDLMYRLVDSECHWIHPTFGMEIL